MNEPRPLVSVLMPAYNAAAYIAEAIESALYQTWQPVEVIVVNDGSTDETSGAVRRYVPPVRLFDQCHAGIGASRNRALEEAHGEYIAMLDADDYWPPEKLERQMAVLTSRPEVDFVFGAVSQFVSPELSSDEEERRRPSTVSGPGLIAGTCLGRRTAFARVGPFRADLKVGEFVDWWARAAELGARSVSLPEVMLHRRLHRNNTVTRERAAQSDYVRVVHAALARRRAKAAVASETPALDKAEG
ncbi:MAG: glycosyltransferase family 2 protein, partial [Acidobacteriales bacterium]